MVGKLLGNAFRASRAGSGAGGAAGRGAVLGCPRGCGGARVSTDIRKETEKRSVLFSTLDFDTNWIVSAFGYFLSTFSKF